MPTECSVKPMVFARVDGRAVVADFDGGEITSNAGGLLLGATHRSIGLIERFAGCFTDGRAAERVVHEVATLVGQRVFGIALGYEDLVDHDRLRHDPVLGVVLGRWAGAARPVRAARRQEHAQPAGDDAAGRPTATPDRADGRDRSVLRGPVSRCNRSRRRRSFSISTPPTIHCTVTNWAVSSTAITRATATCRCTSSAASDCWRQAQARRHRRRRRSSRGRRSWPVPRALAQVRIILRGDSGFAVRT